MAMHAPSGCSAARLLLIVCVLGSPAWSQLFVPSKSKRDEVEMNSRTNYPFMRSSSRSQFLIDRSELGSASVALTKLAFRYDGPSFGSRGGTIKNFEIYLANSTVTPGSSTPYFAANVTGSLTRVVSKQNYAFGLDVGMLPSKWGGPKGEFLFTFAAPFAYTGGTLVVEIRADGNTNSGSPVEDCMLDAEEDQLSGPIGGAWTPNGKGCAGATLAVSGQLAPGGQISCHGKGLGAKASAFLLIGLSRQSWGGIPLPFPLDSIGAPGCSIYNDSRIELRATPSATGAIEPYRAETLIGLPQRAFMANKVLQFQFASLNRAANRAGLATSNNVEVRLGSFRALKRGYVGYFHHKDRNAPVAAMSAPVVPAMRFN